MTEKESVNVKIRKLSGKIRELENETRYKNEIIDSRNAKIQQLNGEITKKEEEVMKVREQGKFIENLLEQMTALPITIAHKDGTVEKGWEKINNRRSGHYD